MGQRDWEDFFSDGFHSGSEGVVGTHMLSDEAEDWWGNMCQRTEDEGIEVTWVVFITNFLDNYFPEGVRSKKEIEFLELKQGNLIVVEHATYHTPKFALPF